ncbi:MAG: DUF3783 domain-containing protein [Treponema sp.]|jgi:hypothetical protein|nr:DUF3783 domain-containing protein [Treponema sp.]
MSNSGRPGVNPDPVIFPHGFKGDALMAAVRAIKAASAEAGMGSENTAFTTPTPVNLEWKMKALIREDG